MIILLVNPGMWGMNDLKVFLIVETCPELCGMVEIIDGYSSKEKAEKVLDQMKLNYPSANLEIKPLEIIQED